MHSVIAFSLLIFVQSFTLIQSIQRFYSFFFQLIRLRKSRRKKTSGTRIPKFQFPGFRSTRNDLPVYTILARESLPSISQFQQCPSPSRVVSSSSKSWGWALALLVFTSNNPGFVSSDELISKHKKFVVNLYAWFNSYCYNPPPPPPPRPPLGQRTKSALVARGWGILWVVLSGV